MLRRGVDFDQVVLGISIGGLKPICADLGGERNTKFQAMLDNLTTVGTRAVQVWSGKSTADLGWSPTVSSISTSYAEPLDTYCDMSHLIPSEAFPPNEVSSIALLLRSAGGHRKPRHRSRGGRSGGARLLLHRGQQAVAEGGRRDCVRLERAGRRDRRPGPGSFRSAVLAGQHAGDRAVCGDAKGHRRVPTAIRREWLQEPGVGRRLDPQRHRRRFGGGGVRLRSDGFAGTVRFALIRARRARTAGRWTGCRRAADLRRVRRARHVPRAIRLPQDHACTRSSRWPTSERSNGWWISCSPARLWVPRSFVRWRRW